MGIKQKLQLIIFCSASIGLLAFSILFFWVSYQVNERFTLTDRIDQVVQEEFVLSNLTNEFLRNQKTRTLTQWKIKYNLLEKQLHSINRQTFKTLSVREASIIQRIKKNHDSFGLLFQELAEDHKPHKRLQPKTTIAQEREVRLHGQIMIRMQAVISDCDRLIKTNSEHVRYFLKKGGILLILFAISIIIFGGVIISIWTSAAILRPIIALTNATSKIGTGKFDQEIKIKNQDEIGTLASSFNKMAKDLQQSTVSKEYLNDILKSMVNCLIVIDSNLIIQTVNHATYDLLNYEEGELIGKPISNIMDKENNLFAKPELDHSSKPQMLQGVEINFLKEDGTRVPILFSGAPMITNENHITGFVCVAQDITERKEIEKKQRHIEAQLHQAQKMEALGVLAGGIAHDFNNMLAAIIGNASLMRRKLPKEIPEMKLLERISTAGQRAIKLVQQILIFSRMENINCHCINAYPIVQEAIEMIKATTPANIRINQNLKKDCGTIMANETQLHQIILNLCTNAAHAMEEEGGVLEVTMEETRELPKSTNMLGTQYLKLIIRDNGIGIPQEIQEHIFDPFFTTKESGKGTGLGLSVVHGIVEKMNGDIILESSPGEGTTFTIFFPILDQKKVIRQKETTTIRKGSGQLLIVEDEPIIMNMYREFLEAEGYDIIVCKDGSEALKLFQKDPTAFDLVLTDQSMPEMTGKQLCQELLTIRADLPIILTTGYSSTFSRDEAKRIGIQKYLLKPLELEELSQIIHECLSNI